MIVQVFVRTPTGSVLSGNQHNDVLQRNIEAGHKAIRVFWDTYEDHQRCILRAKEASNAE